MDNINTNLGRSSWLRWGEWGEGRIDLILNICKNHWGEDNEDNETKNWPIARGWAADTGRGMVLPCAHLLQVPSQHMFTLYCFLAKLHVCNSSSLRRPYIMELRQVSSQELCHLRPLHQQFAPAHLNYISHIIDCLHFTPGECWHNCWGEMIISCADLLPQQ